MRQKLASGGLAIFSLGVVMSFSAYAQQVPEMDPNLVAGRVLFEETAGDVGCAACHGVHGEGGEGPKIVGQSAENIKAQFQVNDSMSFIEMTDEQLELVEGWLNYLHELERH
ncbi:c-type cytochrome [Phaeovulum sp.]|uniref:c-type cytochrome n=1 Tax=Phaeovulum sp. TaxID=2934796 RepID=UPI0035620DFC